MAKDIETIGRQVGERAQDIGASTAYGRLSESLAGVAVAAASKYSGIKIEEAALQGAEDRIKYGPNSQKLIPGVTKATQAYNNASHKMDNALNVLAGEQEMSRALVEAAKPENMRHSSAAELAEKNRAIITGVLQNTHHENHPEVAFKLSQISSGNELRMLEHVNTWNTEQIQDSYATMIIEASQTLTEAAIRGDKNLYSETYNSISDIGKDLVTSGIMTKANYAKVLSEFQQAGINGWIEKEFNEALYAGGEEGAARYIQNYHETNYEHMTQAQKDAGFSHLMSIASRANQAMSQASQLGYMKLSEMFADKMPTDINQVNEYIEKSATEGLPLNESQAHSLRQHVRSALKQVGGRTESNNEINTAVYNKDVNGLIATSTKDLDNWYIDSRKALTEARNQEMMESKTDAQRIMANRPEWMISATIAANMPVPIAQFTDELSRKINRGGLQDKLDAMHTVNYLATANPAALDKLSKQDTAYASRILADMKDTKLSPELIIQRADNDILNVSPEAKKNREKAWTTLLKDRPNVINDMAKEVFGNVIEDNISMPGANIYGTVERILEDNFYIHGNINDAMSATKEELGRNAKVSIFGPSTTPVWNPVENLPYYDFGHVTRNQATKYLKEITINARKHPGTLPYEVRWSSKMPEFPESISEEDLFSKKYDKGEWWLNINGKDRRVYFVSPNFNQSTGFATNKYQVLLDNGQQLIAINKSFDRDGKEVYSKGNALMAFLGPNEMVPNMVTKMSNETADAGLTRAATRLYEKENPEDYGITLLKGATKGDIRGHMAKEPGTEDLEEKARKSKYIEKQKEELPKRIEKEKLSRQQSEAKTFLENMGVIE